ncbi:uncharacterized protein C2845_PM03G27300 [Panicum miliaceum]|uniref:Transposase-associated domain-containing protein n=1 Tax=Panicum miliaceum TaxID=4540 RepID=A0A3L6TCI8_PANMI|nr:uncharacterized protein C2845_PM03G27300 [Panicum miliaceum]
MRPPGEAHSRRPCPGLVPPASARGGPPVSPLRLPGEALPPPLYARPERHFRRGRPSRRPLCACPGRPCRRTSAPARGGTSTGPAPAACARHLPGRPRLQRPAPCLADGGLLPASAPFVGCSIRRVSTTVLDSSLCRTARGWMTVRGCTRAGNRVGDLTVDWIQKTDAFLDRAFEKLKGAKTTWCPCSRCGNTRRQTKQDMTQHLCNYGFTRDYTRWT